MTRVHHQSRATGSVLNQVQNVYNDFAQLTRSYQAHDGEVNTGMTSQVQYSYADGSSNTIRITGMTYPNGRNVVDDYGTTGSMNDAASRLGFVCLTSCGSDFSRFQASEQRERVPSYRAVRPTGSRAMPLFGMKDAGASSNLVEYSYLGLSGFVKTVYPVSGAQYTLIGTTGGTNPDSGDIYLGLDRFGRVIDANWANVAGTATLARVKYGYNRVSSRTWRDNLSPGMTGYDELYGYDQLQRLQNLDRGTLNGTQTAITSDGLKKVSGTLEATPDNSNEGSTESSRHLFQHITSPTFGQDWSLDETGNWNGFKQSDNGSTWPLDQTRTANTVNEITSLVNETSKAWTTPAYDKAGNMTRIPVPGTLPDGVAWNPMTLSDWDNLKLAEWDEMTLDNVEGVYDAWNRLVRLHVGDTTLAEYAYDARAILPPLPQFFAVSASFHMAASPQKIGGEGWGEGAVFACCHPRKPPHPAWRPPSPPKRARRNCTDNIQTEARHYYYTPGWQVVEERVGTNTSANRQFVWGLRYIDDMVLRDRDADGNGTLDERRYCLQDGNWNTIALTSPFGIVTERFSYDAYGVPTFLTDTGTVQASSATGWETLYAGYRWDGDPSRMYYVRNRFLLPYVGTWNRRDPLRYVSGDANLSRYVRNSSPNAVDPVGLAIVVEGEQAAEEFRGTLMTAGVAHYIETQDDGHYYFAADARDLEGVFKIADQTMPMTLTFQNKESAEAIEQRRRFLAALLFYPESTGHFCDPTGMSSGFTLNGVTKLRNALKENQANSRIPRFVVDIGGEGPLSANDASRSKRININPSGGVSSGPHLGEKIPHLVPQMGRVGESLFGPGTIGEIHIENVQLLGNQLSQTLESFLPGLAPGAMIHIGNDLRGNGLQQAEVRKILSDAGYRYRYNESVQSDPTRDNDLPMRQGYCRDIRKDPKK